MNLFFQKTNRIVFIKSRINCFSIIVKQKFNNHDTRKINMLIAVLQICSSLFFFLKKQNKTKRINCKIKKQTNAVSPDDER